MTSPRTGAREMAEAYADKLWNTSGEAHDWCWEDSKRDFLAGFHAGIEEAARVAESMVPEGMYHVPKTHVALQVCRKIRAMKGEG